MSFTNTANSIKNTLKEIAPSWMLHYEQGWLYGDFVAGIIVTIMLIPQSLAYALIAGLPPEVGLYASILPLVAYALFGSSMTLAVGPVAVASLMTASALVPIAVAGSELYITLAVQLAFLSGVLYLILGFLRFGFLAHLLSHPVVSGFITGSAILIAIGQLKHILGVKIAHLNVIETAIALWNAVPETNIATLTIGVSTIVFLYFAKSLLPYFLCQLGFQKKQAEMISKLAPMLVVITSIFLVTKLNLHVNNGVNIVGFVPSGIPDIRYSLPSWSMFQSLWLPALLISVVGFVESVSVGQSLAIKRQQKINLNRELFGLGAANVASAFSGGYPVTGGFSRSVVNFSAGANTPLAGVISAALMMLVLLAFTGSFSNLPQAVLSGTIIVAVLGLADFSILKDTWKFDKADSVAFILTFLGLIALGVEEGILIGVVFSLGSYFWRASHPHIAVVGRISGTEHFRNVERHQVETDSKVLTLRVDESLFFGNVQGVEDIIHSKIASNPMLTDVLLIMSAVNRIDSTALMVLNDINRSLKHTHKRLHLAEVKGPVLDTLKHTVFFKTLTGKCFLSGHEAYNELT
jgi:SulP family sulfate permease|tara:strand:+ start:11751 stop:13484 length:1734 start_codon:yes stop_codon:yes gene_type:complete